MSAQLPPCPHCGKEDFLVINAIWEQAMLEVFDPTGRYMEAGEPFGAYSRRRSANAVRCGACGKIRRDLHYNLQEIVAVTP